MLPDPRPCLACGYDLQGLGESPRCPECGLLNIPDGYRQQVWELVDSGKWFFSSFFGVLRKRLPGWWWSLDRDGDISKSVRFATFCLIGSILMVIITGTLCGSIVREETTVTYTKWNVRGPRTHDTWYQIENATYLLGEVRYRRDHGMIETLDAPPPPPKTIHNVSAVKLSFLGTIPSLFLCLLLVCTWLVPAGVGLSTQFRKSLPSFARPPRTIWSAALFESHRVVYAAILASGFLWVDACARWNGWSPSYWWTNFLLFWIALVVATISMLGWIGPLRSDYTNQLIQSRRHALRILFMYCWSLPLAICGTFWWFYATRGY